MEGEGLPLDIISNLPSNIIQTILTLMPMRDAFRTSILSPNWRYHCLYISKLEFNDNIFEEWSSDKLSNKYRMLHVIDTILLLHLGVVLEFSLCISRLQSCCEIDQIILHLARNTNLEKFNLCFESGEPHKLLSSFYSLQQLTHLKLQNCAFQPSSTFRGFSRLTTLYFKNVGITTKVLLQFIGNCPLLKSFTLFEDDKHFTRDGYSDFAELFKCLPLIEYLQMNCYPIKCFATGVMPQKLPTAIVHLKVLHLSGLSFAKEDEFHSALLLVTNAPNIEKIKMEVNKKIKMERYVPRIESNSYAPMNLFNIQDYSYVKLDHLRELEITEMEFVMGGMEFVKLILAKSSRLENIRLVINTYVNAIQEVEMLRNLLEYPRVSEKAKIIVRRPKILV